MRELSCNEMAVVNGAGLAETLGKLGSDAGAALGQTLSGLINLPLMDPSVISTAVVSLCTNAGAALGAMAGNFVTSLVPDWLLNAISSIGDLISSLIKK